MLGDGILLMQRFSSGIQTGVVKQFEDLLTRAVREIFGRDYRVDIEFQAKGNSMWAEFYITLPNGRRVSLSNGEGGGFNDLCAFMNRILYLILDPTQPARILVMDESLSGLDEWRSPMALPLIMRIANELGIQVLFVTHDESISSGDTEIKGARVVKFSLQEERTVCEVIKNA